MAFNLSGGYGAGAGADMLQQILKQKALEFAQAEQRRQEDERIAIDRKRQTSDDEIRRMAAEDRADRIKSEAASRAQTSAGKLSGNLAIGQDLSPVVADALEKGGLGDTIKAPTLSSRNFTGSLPTLKSVANPGRGETYLGTAPQQQDKREDDEFKRLLDTSDEKTRERLQYANSLDRTGRRQVIGDVMREDAKVTPKPPSVQEYEYAVSHDGFKGSYKDYQDEDANRKKAAAGGGSTGTPYFTYQPTYDATGQPIGAIRFDARGGPPVRVGVEEMGGLLKPPTSKIVNKIIDNEVVSAQLDRLNAMFEGDEKTPGAKNFVGPAAGRWEILKQNLPDMGIPGMDVHKVFTDFGAQTATIKNTFVNAITGAAVGEKEEKRIMGQIPLETDRAEVWKSKMEQSRRNMQDLVRIIEEKARKAAGGGGGTGGAPPPAGTAPPAGATPPRQGIRYDMNGKRIEG